MMKKSLFIVLSLCVSANFMAQNTYYSCDFEKESDRNRWTLNPVIDETIGQSILNKWYLGGLGNNTLSGSYGLYISNDNGANNHYSKSGCVVFAYDTVTLDKIPGAYSFTFDYKAMGNQDSKFDGLYAFWIPLDVPVYSSSTGIKIPADYADYVIELQPDFSIDYVNGANTWMTCYATLSGKRCDGKPHILAFAWANGSTDVHQPAGCIDNIEIADTRNCERVKHLDAQMIGSTVQLKWDDNHAMGYELSVYNYEQNTWTGPIIIQDTIYRFVGLASGQTDFYVRTICDTNLMSPKASLSELVYYPDEMCVDYLNLDNAVCYVNAVKPPSGSACYFNDFRTTPPVDMGPLERDSRHTVHFDKNEYDLRTGNQLKTIPDGELASVRLGNWNNGDEAERIEFSFDVDTAQFQVLMLKYAVIIEAPGHEDCANPRFKMDVLVGGESIGRCGKADFNCNDVYYGGDSQGHGGKLRPGAEKQGWHITDFRTAQLSADVVWKDWTTVGVNMRDPYYQGKRLTIQLTTHDCTAEQHCGYAYFTLGCSDGKLQDMNCGEINPTFKAPDGFVYRWYLKNDETLYHKNFDEKLIVSREQEYDAGMNDDNLYGVDCMFVQDTTCYFTLYATTLANHPVSVIPTPRIEPICSQGIYKVYFDGTQSYVQQINHLTNDTSKSSIYHVENYEWDLGDGTRSYDAEVMHEYPSTGGDWDIRLRTLYGTCDTVVTYHLHLDSISATTTVQEIYLCDDMKKNGGYVWPENQKSYTEYGIDSIVLYNEKTSCDSIIYLNLKEPIRIHVDTLIFDDDLPFTYHGKTYTQSCLDTIPSALCDTTWCLNLIVYETLEAQLRKNEYTLCEGDSVWAIEYSILKGFCANYSLDFGSAEMPKLEFETLTTTQGNGEIIVPISRTAMPNIYNAHISFHDTVKHIDVVLPIQLTINYNKSFIAQRWNDILAVHNSSYQYQDGRLGYEFSAFQWYKNGQLLEGENSPYLYVPETGLDVNAWYSVELTRTSDGVKLLVCPMQPELLNDIVNIPSLVPAQTTMKVQGRGIAKWYNLLGVLINEQPYDSFILTPMPGTYLLRLQPIDNTSKAYKIIVK